MLMNTIKPGEILAAAPDFLSAQMGITTARPHPLANSLSLREIAYALGQKIRPQQGFESDAAVVARGLGSSDFSKLLADGVRGVSVASYAAGSGEYLNFCAVTEAQGFKPETVAAIDADLSLKMVNELAEIEHGQAFTTAGGNAVQLTTYARICSIARQLILSDAFATIRGIFAGVGSQAAQLEAALIAEVLSSNPTLDDGEPVFSAANSVALELDAIGLRMGMAMLRNQINVAGNPLNLRARHLVVAPELEYVAKKLVFDAGLDIQATALAGLPPARWFLLPSKDVHPAISVVRLAGTKTPLRIEQKNRLGSDAVAIRATADLGAAFLRRTGIVRGGA